MRASFIREFQRGEMSCQKLTVISLYNTALEANCYSRGQLRDSNAFD